jgi:3-oxoacyl-[acyl-carrier protein] reductase
LNLIRLVPAKESFNDSNAHQGASGRGRAVRPDLAHTAPLASHVVSPEANDSICMSTLDAHLVVISGASRGLGAQIARSAVREGATVVINYYQSEEPARALADELGDAALALQADIRDPEAVRDMVETAVEHFDAPVTAAVHNALIDFRFDAENRPTLQEIDWEAYHTQTEGSVRGALNLLQACIPHMTDAGGGRFVAIGSNLVENPVVPYHDYTTGKAALIGFVRNAAQELGPDGITVNMVSGGLLRTTDASAATSEEVFGIIEQTTPLRKVTTPEEVADAVLFFLSPWSRAVTGQTLVVDGGLVMR